MTIQSQTTRVDYTGNGATTNFPVPFYWLQDTDLLVIRTDNAYTPPTVATLALGTDYVVTGSGNQSGGSITTTVAPTATQKLSILRNVPFTQLTHYVPNDPFPAASHEQALDKLTMETQQLNEGLSRSITLPPNATGLSTSLPLPAASNLIGWNATANALQNVDPTTIATSVTYGNAVADKFSGDGATVNFNLSANPGGINNLDVSISGVTQRPGIDYTWTSGTTLTFTSAPPAGTNNVLARYTQALPVGTLGVGQVVASNLAAGAVGNAAMAANAIKDINVDPAAAIQSSKVAFLQAGTGAVSRSAQSRLRDTVSVKDFGAVGDGVTDATAAFNAAIAYAQTIAPGGQGATVFIPQGSYLLSATISVPDRIKLVGSGSRTTILNNSFNGVHFLFAGVTFSGISKVRIGLGSGTSMVAISITTPSNNPSRWNTFKDLEIAGSLAGGQVGIQANVSGTGIITENVFDDIKTFSVHAPIVINGVEGNFFTNLSLLNYGATSVAAISSVSAANFFQGRIAGNPATGSVGYAEGGDRNVANLVFDIKATATALSITGVGNRIICSRPELLTPIGSYSNTTCVVDSEFIFSRRTTGKGTAPTSAQFSLGAGFGSTATVTSITGSDQRIRFVINSSGTGQSANPTVSYAFLDGSWPFSGAIVQATRDGGNQQSIISSGANASTSGWGFTFNGTPVSGESYAFVVTVG